MQLTHFNTCNFDVCRQPQVWHRKMRLRNMVRAMVCVGIVCVVASVASAASPKLDAIESAERAEAARIAVIERIAPAVVCIFDTDERGGGSGVIISPDGYGLTNYHVVEGMIESRSGFGGLADGKLYPLQVLGIDPGGDVAMFKLDGLDRFPFATLGDSDKLQVGDTAIAMGNPFLLSDDYTPTVTMGIVSGIHRYQYGSGDALLYSDCIQVDTAINPGNSGGPLFNERGEIIGINGRISVSMRGRVNVGLGYAITSNQIKPFIPGLRAGLLVDHGTIQAIVRDRDNGVIFVELLEDGPAWNIGVRPGDELLRFAGQPIRSANHFASVLGTLPGGWPVAVSYRDTNGALHHRETRTEAVKVKRSEGFVPDPDVAMLAVEKILARFRKTIDADAIKKSPRTWRETLASADAPESPPLEYEVKEALDGAMTWTVTNGVANNVSINEKNGEWVATTNGAPLSVGMDLAHRARHFVQQRLIRETDNSTARGLEHCGADAILDIAADGTVQSTLLECISARLGEHASIRLGFDAKNGNLRRIIATDNPTKEVARLTFTDAQGWPLDAKLETALGKHSIKIGQPDDTPTQPRLPTNTTQTVSAESDARIFQEISQRVVKLTGARVGRSEGYGCGIIVSTSGLVLTVDSGLLNSQNVRAQMSDGSQFEVELVQSDHGLQLALLQLKPSNIIENEPGTIKYPFVELEHSTRPTIGETVYACGNPFKVAARGENISFSKGVYCGTTKLDATRGTVDFPYRGDVLIIDAITSTPGFSGGGLIDNQGKLLGLVGRSVESRLTHTQLNYAIPVDVLARFVQQTIHPSATGGDNHVEAQSKKQVYHGIKFFEMGYRSNPVYVERVRRRSPAARAGVRKDDLVIGANGRPVSKLKTLRQIIDACSPGDVLELTVLRDNKVHKIRVELESKG